MGFFSKLFGSAITCPACRVAGAKDSFFGVRCGNQFCPNYDESMAKQPAAVAAQTSPTPTFDGPVVEFENSIEVQYINFRGEKKTFVADGDSIENRAAHLNMAVAPTGRRITLNPEKILNRVELENAKK